ncbi:MAG: 2-oxoglutarate dehydrogenase complex dihydrolipoyllysine-residue succinyltransferase [Phycisphaerales bacterium]
MPVDIVIPSVGESVTEVTIAEAHKASGDWVERDDPIVDLETDKATMPVLAPAAGVLKLAAAVGDTLEIGASIGTVDEKAKKPAGAASPDAAASSSKQPEGAAKKAVADRAQASTPGAGASNGAATATTTVPPASTGAAASNGTASSSAARATPLAEKLAEELGIDISRITGTGAGHRVREQDVLAAAQSRSGGSATTNTGAPGQSGATAAQPARAVTRERMSALRQRIATRLVEAQHTAAMLTTFNEVDMTAVMDIRKRYKEQFEKAHNIGLGFMSFFVTAATSALKAFPNINAYIVEDNGKPAIEKHDYCDVAVAVSTPRGLVVPVLRNAERMSFAQIESQIKDFATRAQAGTLELAEMQGGTFTITNGGVFGSLMSTPILNPPQSAILGMHTIKKRPVEDPDNPGHLALRPMMYLAVSYDHRIVDGADAVRFLVHIKDAIENPERMLIGL